MRIYEKPSPRKENFIFSPHFWDERKIYSFKIGCFIQGSLDDTK